jgi:hypothetical protein
LTIDTHHHILPAFFWQETDNADAPVGYELFERIGEGGMGEVRRARGGSGTKGRSRRRHRRAPRPRLASPLPEARSTLLPRPTGSRTR